MSAQLVWCLLLSFWVLLGVASVGWISSFRRLVGGVLRVVWLVGLWLPGLRAF